MFLVLYLKDTLFHSLPDDKSNHLQTSNDFFCLATFFDAYRLFLTETMDSVHGLWFHCLIPPGIHDEHLVGHGQVQAHASGFVPC